MSDGFVFKRESDVKRIAKAVRATEGAGSLGGPQGGGLPYGLSPVLVRITANATGGGKYFGYTLLPPEDDISPLTILSQSEMGTVPEAANSSTCLILNTLEENSNTHDLTNGGSKVTTFIGFVRRVNDDGTIVVVINGLDWVNCSAS